MKTLCIKKGMTLNTPEGFQIVTEKHFDGFSAENYKLVFTDETDMDGTPVLTGTVILTASDIRNKFHDMTGESYDTVLWQDESVPKTEMEEK